MLVKSALNAEGERVDIRYEVGCVVDSGTFGVVMRGRMGGRVIAVKKVLQDPQYKNREVEIMKTLSHRNIVRLEYYYYERRGIDKYLYILMEYVPTNIANLTHLTPFDIKMYMYQMFCALNYMHNRDILHRDIKPSNLLVDPQLVLLKLCDFGNAKKIQNDEPSVDYICSRYYRAPELIFGAIIYSTAVDVWSAGCVLAECYLSRPLFQGADSNDQLVKIIRMLGTPTVQELADMKQRKHNSLLPHFQRVDLHSIGNFSDDMISLLDSIFQYSPSCRPTCRDILTNHYFDVLFDTPNHSLERFF